MSASKLSRRSSLKALGGTLTGGGLGAYSLSATGEHQVRSGGDAPASAGLAVARQLVAPLVEGNHLHSWTLEKILPLREGSVQLLVRSAGGDRFQLDVYARDQGRGAPRPPAQTERFDVFLANRGDGNIASLEDHGIAAMAMADVIRQNETKLEAGGFMTLTARLAHGAEVVRCHVDCADGSVSA